jgi:hypothetical protein
MSFWEYKYGGCSVRERFDNLVGTHAGPIEWVFRFAIIAFAMRTMMDPTEHIYIPFYGWVIIALLVFFT